MVSIYRLKWVQLAVTSSMLRPVPKAALVASLGKAEQGTTLQAEWNEATSHLVMTSISLSLKVVNCLASAVPIVTPEYFRDFVAALTSRQQLPQTSSYIPPVAETGSETQLRDPGITFGVSLERSRVFHGLTLVFQIGRAHV